MKQLLLYRPLINPSIFSSLFTPIFHSICQLGLDFQGLSLQISIFSRASSQWILSCISLFNSWNISTFFPSEMYQYLSFIDDFHPSIPSQNFCVFPSQNIYVSDFLKNGSHCVCLICYLNQLLILCII